MKVSDWIVCERAAEIDAEFEIQTVAGRGTSMNVTVPITS
jgi:signal transduction histidine kinase